MKSEKHFLNKLSRHFVGMITVFTLALFFGCHSKQEAEDVKEAFVLNDSMAKKIQLTTVTPQVVEDELKLTAKIEYNQDKVVDVRPFVSGRVNSVNVELGDFVTKGQTLAYVLSGDVSETDRALLVAQGNLASAQRKYDASNDMLKSGLLSEKDLIQIKAEYEIAQAELKKAKEVSSIYGSKSAGLFEVKAPVSGCVVKKNITESMDIRLENTEPLFTICDLSVVWVMANVYETDIQKIKVGYDAEISTIAYPDSIIKGKVDKLFNVLDPENKVMKARITLNNPDYLLKPQMFAKVDLRYNEEKQMLTVPASAVIFDKSKTFVMVYKDNAHIDTREITIYKSNSQNSYIQSGLKEGEKIISKFQLLVYDAIND
jgi:cobalt-zinc-cadmium efflux system membrane fusion protein